MPDEEWVTTPRSGHLRGRRSKDTTPELLLRRALHAMGARYRLHRRIAPICRPDLVLPKYRIAVFVDGDYWHSCPIHGHNRPFVGPNAALWEQKMLRNKERDRCSTALAEEAGWTVVRLWECTIRADPNAAAQAVLRRQSLPPSG
ncbi:MAG: very short patch repair endonuclease [Pseudonocardiaceae bacterium]|nr:MAG: very short patch repair endonuclease [Pseudonocardiaceae bacterium]